MAQIIFALAYAQRNFAFTHNDLHGNNIMFKKTDKEFLYYFHAGVTYKVPTYGYLLKIIDFSLSFEL
jgi:serine/threonine-protein kinase haspin